MRWWLPLAALAVVNERATGTLTVDSAGLSEAFERDGFVVVEDFASGAECDDLAGRMQELIADFDLSHLSVFRTDESQTAAQGSDNYFLDSADRIHFFLEPGATEMVDGREQLKPGLPKAEAMNKVGHGLHLRDPVFKRYAKSFKVAKLARALGWEHPELPQSMFIFKQPRIGGEVTPHQDSTFLYTEPRTTCLGLWLALEDADEGNGCLWARPGSHREPVRRRFVRNPEYFQNHNRSASQMIFLEDHPPPPYDTSLLQGPNADPATLGFVPLPVRKGTLVAIHGSLDHLSLPNTSPRSRHTFQLHAIDGLAAGVTWADSNWLQYPRGQAAFPKLKPSSKDSILGEL